MEISIIFLIILIIGLIIDVTSLPIDVKTFFNIPENWNFTELATKHGIPVEEHKIVTTDGYVLNTFNIPGDKTRPVLLAHGIFGTSDVFIARGNTSLCAVLFENGYDIWILNLRGNRYSRRHKTLDPDTNKSFWDFSIHEHGISDLASNIDYVLNATGQSELSLIGISEGTTVTFVLTSTLPEYNKKIKSFIALAPVVFLENLEPPASIAIQFSYEINDLLKALDIEEFFGHNSTITKLYKIVCSQHFGHDICLKHTIFLMLGTDKDQFEPDFFRETLNQFPDGTSRKNIAHYAQIGKNKRFAQYDYGFDQNMITYKSSKPPTYDLNKVSTNTYLICGKNDKISTLKDVGLLTRKLPNVKHFRVMTSDKFNHVDHIWAKDAHIISYPFILKILAKYNP